jgi:hypothetical protein
MIELKRKFPGPEMLDRIAAALGVGAHELFAAVPSREGALEGLHRAILKDIERVIGEAVRKAVGETYRSGP